MKRYAFTTILGLILLSGCANTVQTTSGEAYLEKYANVPLGTTADVLGNKLDIDAAVRGIAAVEPVLEFPARIGLVRIGDWGKITDIPEAEALHWADLADRLGDRFGEFVPVNPLIARLVMPETQYRGRDRGQEQLDVVSKIRLVAARQHLDAVLMYEISTSRETRKNALAATDFTLISAFVLPTRKVKGEAVGTALLIDVVQGYPYGTVEARLEEEKRVTAWGASSKNSEIAARLRGSVTAELVVEAEKMFTELRTQLAEQRLKAMQNQQTHP